MLFTEREASNKWCPLVRSAPNGSNADADGGRRLEGNCCIASRCMAWRMVGQIGIGPNGEKRDRDLDGRTQWVDRGFCGAFGEAQ